MAVVLVITVALIAGAASAQLFPPGPGSTPAPSGATAITSGPGDNLFPAISGNSIVWYDNSSASIQLYDVASGNVSTISTAAATPIGLPHELAIAGNNVVWTGGDPQAGGDIVFLYDIASGRLQPVTNGSGAPRNPGVSQDFVIWIDGDELGDVYFYEIASGDIMRATDDPYEQTLAAAGGDTFVWVDNETSKGNLAIAVTSLNESGIRLIGYKRGDNSYPDVSSDGNRIAWINTDGNRTAVYLYDVSTRNATRVTGGSAQPDAVAVDGNYVVYSDWRSGNLDIYLYDISTGMETPVTQDPYAQSFPDISGGRIVWMGQDTGQWEIYEMEVTGASGSVTQVPITQVPITQVPITQVPITQVPVTQVPITQVPVTQVPITQVPITQVPITQVPITQVPITQTPVDGLTITAADIANLQWQEDPAIPGWSSARDQARGLTFYQDPGTPDIILIMTDGGEWYGYSSMTGLVPLNM
ncbi:TolB family protein [Methanoculleus sp.]|uniref:TolB family protein n=1 Tax=Methanoculleus sp. TaxID=90427 RepID=UPI002FC7DC8B